MSIMRVLSVDVSDRYVRIARCVAARSYGMGALVVEGPGLVSIADSTYRRDRRQHDADELLDAVVERGLRGNGHALVLLRGDIFAPGRTFVFGLAHLTKRVAVVSVARLEEGWYGRRRSMSLERVRFEKVVAHEIGHTHGVNHCGGRCVMAAVAHVEDLDLLPDLPCSSCAEALRRTGDKRRRA